MNKINFEEDVANIDQESLESVSSLLQQQLIMENEVEMAELELKDFNDNDHLLMMGDPAAMGIACCVAAEMNRGKFKILKWDKMQKRYYSVQVNLNEKGEIDEQDKL